MAFKLTLQEEKEVVEEYLGKSLTTKSLAEKWQVSPKTIYRAVRRYGYDVRDRGRLPGYKIDWIERKKRTGGEFYDKKGYVMIHIPLDHKFRGMCHGKTSYIPKHRLVMAEYLDRNLTPEETVHHIDGNKSNNDISNLQLRIGQHGSGQSWRCGDCGSINIEPQKLLGGK